MLRNIDRCELLIATDSSLAWSAGAPAPRLLHEAVEQGTCLAFLSHSSSTAAEPFSLLDAPVAAVRHVCTGPLSPSAFSSVRRSFQITPDGFGGSDGFGRAPTQASRSPLASRTVVLVAELAECLCARAAGMRAVGVPGADGHVQWDLEGVADAVVDDVHALFLDDLSTPGAYWLNTMVPFAPGGGPADPDSSLPLLFETGGVGNLVGEGAGGWRSSGGVNGNSASSEGAAAAPSADEEEAEVRRILADFDAL